MKKLDINEVVNLNGKQTTCKVNNVAVRFSFSAARRHFTDGLTRKINAIEGRWLAKGDNAKLYGIAEERHNTLDTMALKNKAFIFSRTALQKGQLPRGYKEKDIKELCFSGTFLPTLEKCELKTGFHTDKLLKAISKGLATQAKENAKSNKKAKKNTKKGNK